jgi:hypothetical protein
MHRSIVFVVVLAMRLAPPLVAQSHPALSLDVTLGGSSGSGGRQDYYDSDDISGEITLGMRQHPEPGLSWLSALTVGRRSPLEFGDKCVVRLGGSSGCAPAFPTFSHVGLLGGGEWRGPATALRVLAGPAFYAGGGPSGVGAQLGLDGAVGFRHLAFVAAARGSWIARVSGETLRCHSLEFGLRMQ